MSLFIKVLFSGLVSLLFIASQGFGVQTLDDEPIHEAYALPITGAIVLDAVTATPPSPINEHIPPQRDSRAIWIKGYWAWSSDRNDFYWVTGVWRLPPPWNAMDSWPVDAN